MFSQVYMVYFHVYDELNDYFAAKIRKKPTFAFNHILNNNRIMKKAVLAVYSYCLFMVLISCLIFLFRMAGHSGVKPFNRSSL